MESLTAPPNYSERPRGLEHESLQLSLFSLCPSNPQSALVLEPCKGRIQALIAQAWCTEAVQYKDNVKHTESNMRETRENDLKGVTS